VVIVASVHDPRTLAGEIYRVGWVKFKKNKKNKK